MKDKKANTSLYIQEDLKTKLRVHAAERKVHITTIITEAIKKYLETD